MIDIAITATVRPKLLERTFETFYNKCFNDYCYKIKNSNLHIVINVDPVGDTKNFKQHHMIDICHKYSNNVTYNTPKKANFAKAVKWVWYNCVNDYVFHLEDDWELNRNTDLIKIINLMDNNEDLAAIKLFKKRYPEEIPYIMFDSDYDYDNDELFIAKNSGTQFGLNPTLIKRSFLQEALPLMSDDLNPEKQFRQKNPVMKDFVLKYKYGMYGVPGDEALVKDIGTVWRNKRNIEKPKGTSFLTWAK